MSGSASVNRFIGNNSPGEVIAQGPHEDERHQATQEDDHHEAIEDAKPVNLVLEEVVLEISIESPFEGLIALHPVHRVRELQLSPHLNRNRILRCEINFKDPVALVSDTQATVSEDVLYRRYIYMNSVVGDNS
jgi:hypothetical protein